MGNSNKSVREEMERIYGRKCMIHNVPEIKRKIEGRVTLKGKYKSKKIASQLTYHHLKPKKAGGKATIENGSLLCRECHDILESLKPAQREEINNMMRQYKLSVTTFTAEKKEPAIEIPIEMEDYEVIKLESNKQRRQRLKRELRKEWEELEN